MLCFKFISRSLNDNFVFIRLTVSASVCFYTNEMIHTTGEKTAHLDMVRGMHMLPRQIQVPSLRCANCSAYRWISRQSRTLPTARKFYEMTI